MSRGKSEKLKSIFPPLPITERGFGIHINGTLKGTPRLVYCNGAKVYVRNLNDPTDVQVFNGHKCNVNIAKFSPNGEQIASGDSQGNVLVQGAKNHIEKNSVRCCRSILDIDWTHDNERIVAVGDGGGGIFGKVFMWNSSNSIGEISNNAKRILSVAFSPKRPFKIVSISEEKQTNFYEGPPFKFKQSDHCHTNYPNCVRYSADGERFATVGSDFKIAFYDGKTAEKLSEIDAKAYGQHTGSIYSCSQNSDGKKLLTASGDKTVKIWDVDSKAVEKTFTFESRIQDMQVACLWLGDHLISVSLSGAINFLDINNPSKPKNVQNGHQKSIESLEPSLDGTLIYSADSAGRIVCWDCKSSEAKIFSGEGHKNKTIAGISLSSDGKKLFSIGQDNKLLISETDSLATLDNPDKLDSQPKCLASGNKNPELCCVGTTSGSLYMYSGSQREPQIRLGFVPSCMIFSPDDSELLIGGEDKIAHIYNVSGGNITENAKLGSHTDVVSSVCYSKDGKFITTTDRLRHIFVWDRSSDFSKPINPTGWVFHQARITGSTWSEDGQLLATCSADQMVIIQPKANEGKSSKREKIDHAHMGGVDVMKAADPTTLVTSGADRCICRWDFTV